MKALNVGTGLIGTVYGLIASKWKGLGEVETMLLRQRYLLGYADGGGAIRNSVP